MIVGLWAVALIRRRAGRLLAAAGGVAVAVALLASIGAFLTAAEASMTTRATHGVAVDWQVQVAAGVDPATVADAARATPGTLAVQTVGFGRAAGLSATADGSTRTTGEARVLGIPDSYRDTFPAQLRTLAGADTGVLVAQQTAANLGIRPGQTFQINGAAAAATTVTVDGIVDLPAADTLFQVVGAPPGSQPSAPPDNVVLLPESQWRVLFGAAGGSTIQIHVARDHALPAAPATAYMQATGAARNFEARLAGAATVGDNLAATLDAARSDAAYARVLFLFLATPGVVLAGLLTAAVVDAGAGRRRAEQALLRQRGAGTAMVLVLAGVEALIVGVVGALFGVAAAAVLGLTVFASAGSAVVASGWADVAAVLGLVLAALTVLGPAWRDHRRQTVTAARQTLTRPRAPWWTRWGLDLAVLAVSGVVFWLTGQSDYTLVLAPEGVAQISVSYWAFAGPFLLWIGIGLLGWRLADLLLARGRPLLKRALVPVAGRLAPVVAASLARRRRPLARSVVLVALALAFAGSTATFNATYVQQAEADAALTNGADVIVTESPGAPVGPAASAQLAALPGVRSVEPLQHRFGYVGTDIQDVFGVRPSTITNVTVLRDTYFQGGTARQLMDTLAAEPDSILVSAETVKDFQLLPGDLLNLRLPAGRGGQLMTVPFHYVGVVTEFPTAPKDSFFVANAAYLAEATGSDAVGAFLVDTGGVGTTDVAAAAQALLGPTARVTDIADVRARIGSSLTAVDLSRLTQVELGFALVLAVAAGGLVAALGLTERRRSTAITAALGASPRQLRAFTLGEVSLVTVGGVTAGAIGGWLLSLMLVAVLTGVFDPPPTSPTVPWGYLALVTGLVVLALGSAGVAAARTSQRTGLQILRGL